MSGFWQEEQDDAVYRVPDDVQDVVFRIQCRALPVDHAQILHHALIAALPWLRDEPLAGIHLIHGAESGNGWQRPEADGDQLLHLSRRARLSLRLPRSRLDDARALCGQRLRLDEFEIDVGEASNKALSDITTLFARYVNAPMVDDEMAFLHWAQQTLLDAGVRARKMLAGRRRLLNTDAGPLPTRSLMLAGLEVPQSVQVQQQGLGEGRLFGCGLFLPHKSVEPVSGARTENTHPKTSANQ